MKAQCKAKCSIHEEHHKKRIVVSIYLKRKKARLREGYDWNKYYNVKGWQG